MKVPRSHPAGHKGKHLLSFPRELQSEMLAEACAIVSSAVHPSKSLLRYVTAIERRMGCAVVAVERHRPEDHMLELLAGKGMGDRRKLLPVGKSVASAVVRTGKPLIVPAPRGAAARMMRGLSLQSLLILPLSSGRVILGVLTIGLKRAMEFDTKTMRFFASLAAQATVLLERERGQSLLRAEAEKYCAIFNSVSDSVFMLDASDGTIIDVNAKGSQLTGYRRSQLIGRSIATLYPPRYVAHYRLMVKQLQETGPLSRYGPLELVRKGGKHVPVEFNATEMTIDGRPTIVAIARDISEQKRAEVKLAASEELLRIIVDGTLDMFFFVQNTKGLYTYVSPSVEKLTGHSPERWKERSSRFPTPNPINDQVRVYRNRAIREGVAAPTYLCEVRHADGRPILLEINEKPILKGGKVIGLQGVARDITEKKRLEETILESRDNLNRILDQSPLAVTVLDSRGNLVDVNEAWMRLFGAVEKDQVVGRLNVFHSRFVKSLGLADSLATVYKKRTVDIPSITIDPRTAAPELFLSGVERTVHLRMFPVTDRNDKLVNVVAMMEDVTEKRHLEEQLIQSQKMESIGLLAGGIAHDFNNILGGILGYSSFVKSQVSSEDKIYPHLETIERSALRAAELTSQLLGFARGGKYVVGPMFINELVHETAELLRGSIESNVAVEVRLDGSEPVIEADASQMQQVLMNLCVNARDAMPGGGQLTIVTQRLNEPDVFLRSIPEALRDAYVRIDIADTGVGIDKSIRGKIFDPFFTTKEKGKGTGLGLATVYGIVKNHGGFVNVESTVGVGTTFSVYIPAVEKSAPKSEETAARPSGGKETILIVDDEETIRMLVRDALEERGYVVLKAADGYEALEVYAEKGSEIDLVILDMTMPGMGGRETFDKLKEINPGIRVVLSTGYSQDERARDMLARGVKAFVQKPYRIDELAGAVRKVLDAPE